MPASAGIFMCSSRRWLSMLRRLLPLLLSGACGLSQAVPHISPDRLQSLANEPFWLSLGHYERGMLGWRSYVDDGNYFLAERGEQDPLAELQATGQALYQDPALGDRHPQCSYPARTRWLRCGCRSPSAGSWYRAWTVACSS